jgi:hypothetical protein
MKVATSRDAVIVRPRQKSRLGFSPAASSPEPVIGWNTTAGRPTPAEKKATTTKHGITTPDNLVQRVFARNTQMYIRNGEKHRM